MHRACCQVGSRPLLHGSPPLPSVSPPSLCLSLRGAGRLHRDVAMTVGRCHRAPCPHSPAPAATQQVSTHPTHPTALHPLTRRRLLHVIANQCAHWCGNPFSPQRSLASWYCFGQIRSTFPYSPEVPLSVMPCRKENGLPRRFAPRNDMQKYAACTHGNYVVPGQIRYAFRIRQGHCRAAPSALSAHSLPSESVTQQCTETQRTGKAPR